MIGQRIAHYNVTGKLGAGGMGEVYRARDEKLERDVALKVLPASSFSDPAARARLLREARSAASLNHPNICTIHEVGEVEGQAYIAMELVEGQPLSDRLAAGPLLTEQVLRYGSQIAAALAHAHERKIIHRDLKSANVVITGDGRAKVLDFGLAKRVRVDETDEITRSQPSLTGLGAVVGTLAYMSPEQLRGLPAEVTSDIWALGVVLYQMAASERPFQGGTGLAVSSAILREQPAPLPPRVPVGLRAVIERCLAKEPGERYRSASEVRAALEALHSDAGPAGARRRVPRWAIAGGVLLILAVLLGFFLGKDLSLLVGSLRGKKTPADSGRRLSTGGTPSASPEANEYFERGVLFMGVQLDIPRARQMFEAALEFDPHFAEARSWHAYTDLVLFDSGYSNDTSGFYKAEEELRRALQDDPSAGHPHSVLAGIYLYQGRKELVPGEAEKALTANPDDLEARTWLLGYHWLNGDYAAAEALVKQSMQRAPLNLYARVWYGAILREQRETKAATRELEKVLEQDPQLPFGIVFLAQTYMDRGELRAARQTLERARSEDRRNFWMRITWALLLALEGNRVAAAKELDIEVLKYCTEMPWAGSWAAEVYAVLGEKEKALEWLERGVRNGDERMAWFQRDPLLANIRGEPRFKQILSSIAFRRQQRQPAAR